MTSNFKFICKHLLKLYHSAWYRATNSKRQGERVRCSAGSDPLPLLNWTSQANARLWHSMQTPTAFKTLKRLSAQLMRNTESTKLEMPLIAAAEYGRISVAHRSNNLWHFKLWNRGDLKGMNRDIDDPYRQSGAMCLSRYKKMHPAAVAALDQRFLPASEVYYSPTLFHTMWLTQVH